MKILLFLFGYFALAGANSDVDKNRVEITGTITNLTCVYIIVKLSLLVDCLIDFLFTFKQHAL